MKIIAFFLLPYLLFFTACGGGSSSVQDDSDSTQFLSVEYAPAAEDVPIGIEKIVTVTFSAAIDRTSVDDASVYIKDANGGHVPAALIIADNRVSVIPTDFFSQTSLYTLVVRTTVQDVDGRSLKDDFSFAFTTSTGPDVSPPSLVSYAPLQDTSVDQTSHVIMEFDETIVADEQGLFELIDRDTNASVAGVSIVSDHEIRFAPLDVLDFEGNYTATLLGSVTDVAGNEYNGTRTSWDFSVDPFTESTPPSLLSTTPTAGVSVDDATNIIMEFDETIAANTVGLLELNVTGTSTTLPGTTTVDGSTVTFDPTALLTQGQGYTATLLGAVYDSFGNEYNGTIRSWDFSVTPVGDTTAPGLLSLTPSSGASEDIVTEIIMAFDETIADNGATLELKDRDTSTILSGTSSLVGNAIHLTPDSNLTEDGNYTVTLLGSVKDLADNNYTGLTSWDFSVGTVKVLSIHRDDYENSANTITIVFSEDLDLSTVSADDFDVKLFSIPLIDQTKSDYIETDRVVTFKVNLKFPTSTYYNVTVSGDIKNLDGNSHNNGEEKTYQFRDYN